MLRLSCTTKKDLNVDNFFNSIEFVANGLNKWTIRDQETKINLNGIALVIKNCNVKYTPEKYDKITIELPVEAQDWFDTLENHLRNKDINVEKIIKTNCIGLKLSPKQKSLVLATLRKGDKIDVAIRYNGVWKVNNKIYTSFILVQFRKLEAEEEEEENYFLNEEIN